MDSLITQKTMNNSNLLSWILIVSAIFCCSCRADYNVIIGFLILFLRSQIFSDKMKLLLKATFQILILSLFFDVIWIWQYTSYWRHGEETSDLWKSLSLVHNLTYYLSIFEFLLKFPIVVIIFKQFKSVGGKNNELLNFKYLPTKL